MKVRFHHVHVICSDLEEMIGFFCGVFGAKLVARRKFGESDGASLDLDGVTVNLRVTRPGEKVEPSGPGVGYDHIGVVVPDVDAAYEELKAKGYAFTVTPRDAHDLRIAFFQGPDKVTVELVQKRESA
jgi:catechol 2,3-dioxygenase-like lactoylglutathione lyase family enzyme